MGRRSSFVAAEKIEAIEAYIRGIVGWNQLTDKFGIANSTLQSWIRKYREAGADELREKQNNRRHSSELKKADIEAYLTPINLAHIQNRNAINAPVVTTKLSFSRRMIFSGRRD